MFQRDGYDVHSDATITFTQATLGGEVRIQGIDGPLDVKVIGDTGLIRHKCKTLVGPSLHKPVALTNALQFDGIVTLFYVCFDCPPHLTNYTCLHVHVYGELIYSNCYIDY